ncbi:hypothetical protein Tco_1016336 [Tanacetum coccineum]|uniref:Uncharacterized protein n=1 Tax=Tanacetum coccineum TaxID=301880 RepID=A0ABQ5FNB7_9ASTR
MKFRHPSPTAGHPTTAGHHVAAVGKLFRRSFLMKSKMVPLRPIYPFIILTLLHSPLSNLRLLSHRNQHHHRRHSATILTVIIITIPSSPPPEKGKD